MIRLRGRCPDDKQAAEVYRSIQAGAGDHAPGTGHPPKSRRHLLATKAEWFEFIAAYRAEFLVSRMCSVLQVSRSGYYAWRKQSPSKRKMANQRLLAKAKAI